MTGRIRHANLRQFTRLLLFCLVLVAPVTSFANAFPISANPESSNDGTVRLTWSAPAGDPVQIQRDSAPAFSTPTLIYDGTDSASVITGLINGEYFYRGRVQLPDGSLSAWGNPVKVTVQHHSLARALFFFTLGAVVFISTVLLIAFGARKAE